jgi:hypothetical protein
MFVSFVWINELVVSIVHRAIQNTSTKMMAERPVQQTRSRICVHVSFTLTCENRIEWRHVTLTRLPLELNLRAILNLFNLSSSMGTYLAPFEPYGRQLLHKLIFYDHTRRVQQLNLVVHVSEIIDVHVSTKCLEHTPRRCGRPCSLRRPTASITRWCRHSVLYPSRLPLVVEICADAHSKLQKFYHPELAPGASPQVYRRGVHRNSGSTNGTTI